MNEVEKLKSFIETLTYQEKRCGCLDLKKGQNPFVTISRQAGAGANTLANAILEQLAEREEPLFQNWQRFNQELCKKIAEEPGLKVPLESLLQFEYRSEIEDMMEEIIGGNTPQDVINKKIFQWMRTLAAFGKVILVGRGGVCLTRHLPLGIHVRLIAPLSVRIKRMAALLGLTEKKAKEFVLEQDKSRAQLMKNYFNKKIEDPLLYDAVWNTGAVPMDQIASAVVALIEKKSCICKQEPVLSCEKK